MCSNHDHSSTSRRAAIGGALGAGLLAGLPVSAMVQSTTQVRKEIPSPDGAIEMLMAGNKRFIDGSTLNHYHKTTREKLSDSQRPIAIVLRCADSRSAPEIVFDQGIGDLFVCAVAGNVPTAELVASMEYAISALGTPLIVVMGHSNCGAVDAAISSFGDTAALPGSLSGLISDILPAAIQVKDQTGEKALSEAISINVRNGMERLPNMSAIISDSVTAGKVKIIGGVYDLGSGQFQTV